MRDNPPQATKCLALTCLISLFKLFQIIQSYPMFLSMVFYCQGRNFWEGINGCSTPPPMVKNGVFAGH